MQHHMVETSDSEKPKVGQRRRHLRPEEAAKLITAAGKRGRYPDRDRLLLRLAYRHGLRASEAVGLRWDSFDLEGGTLTIARSKGGRTSTHTVARDDLGALRKMRKATNGPWVFETERRGPLSVDAMQYIVREAGVAAGLGDAVHPHMLRHGAGYALINDGVDVRLVQEFLGHASITSTAIYTAISPRRLAGLRVR
jgi:type 1 fimbriae regulatory protein FimB